ncbi:MAG TPA: hypothetical protein VEX36_02500 [Thermoleophilaceae bacterium]|nr:hypothetical protein [Thermoleophilaceae bacterium]
MALAALSLLLPSAPSYDPWAWIVWGREVALLQLDTTGGPSWKPLPVIFTAIFARFDVLGEGVPPALWLVVARTGVLLSIVLAFKVTRRLAGPGRWTGLAAGSIAALTLCFAPQWLRYAAHGNEVPMAVALMLWGVDRHLDGRRAHALVAVFLACLLRPEVFPFLVLYGAWTWRAEPALRSLTAALAIALPALWLVPDWIGSGDPFGAGRKASSEPSWSLSIRDQPWLAALGRFHRLIGLPLELGALAGAGFAIARRDRRTLALAAVAAAWLALVVAMTEAGFSGSARYFVPVAVIASILTGLAVAWTVQALGRANVAAGALAAVAIAVAVSPWLGDQLRGLDRQADTSAEMVRLQDGLIDAIASAGGPERVVAAGTPTVNRGFMTRLAWETGLSLAHVEAIDDEGLVFTTPGRPMWGRPPPQLELPGPHRVLVRTGAWQVIAEPPPRVTAGLATTAR